jgi:DNA-binding FadR family transcriptional regulator
MDIMLMGLSVSQQRREAEWLRLHAIIDARERDGDLRLPPEPRLCEEIGVSRARLRGLLKRAEDQGLIWRHVGKGTFVGARPIVRDDAVENLSVSVDDLFDARMLIEPVLAAQAALHATTHDIAAMEAILAEMLAAPSFQEWRRLDARLHRQIALATHNSLLVLLYDTLRMPMRLGLDARIEEVFSAPVKPRIATNHEHGALVEAIAAHRSDQAEQIMYDHILSVRDQLFGPR